MANHHYTEHFSLSDTYTNLITDITKDLFANTEINYFIYIRASEDGASNVLMSASGLTREWFEKGYPIIIGYNDEYKTLQTFSYLWTEKLPSDLMSAAREKYNICNAISIVRRYHDYCELFGFADSNSTMDTRARYISCFSDLENYSNYFIRAGKDLINYAMKNPLPEKHALKENKNIFLKNNFNTYKTSGLYGETHFTTGEFFSLQLILKGKSYKEIARILSVSPKTIEKYLSNIKNKVGYHVRDIKFAHEFEGKVELSLCNSKLISKKWI